ncbi:MAG: SMP-30/gluconolactonase/LRE family protein [Limisphaerales bacterium]
MHSLRVTVLGFLLASSLVRAADDYELGPESRARAAGVPEGKVSDFKFSESKVFPETERDGWIYVPAQYDGSKPAALMVFQDGHAYVGTGEGAQMRVPIVFDNLIAKGDMPVTIAVFVNPGHRGGGGPARDGWGNRSNRSFEYDSLGDAYARFLLDELLPFVSAKFQVKFSDDPAMRAISGMSSGGICAWTVAWERPGSFGRVLSQIGSFTNIRGGHVYPALIRKTERKPIRVFLQDGANDLNNLHGNWPLANQEMASAMAFAGYDYRFEFGTGAHNGKHGGAILPESLRWLWRPSLAALPKPLTRDNLRGDEALSKVLPDGGQPGDWELVGSGYGFTDAACADAEGNFYFSDLPKGLLYRSPAGGGEPEPWLKDGPKISGMKFGADGMLYACVQGEGTNNVKRIVAIDPTTKKVETVATSVQPNDLAVANNGFLYFTDTGAGAVVRVPLSARSMSRPPVAAGGINKPNGITLSPDQRQLWVSEYGGTNVWNFLIAADGSLAGGERLAELRAPAGKADSGGDGSITDSAGRIYVTSHLGLQMFDSGGRMGGVISRPQEKGTVSCAFAGTGHAWLYVCSSDKVYRRKTLTSGVK